MKMKKTLISILVMGIGAGLLHVAAAADNQPPAVPPSPGQPMPAPQAQPAMNFAPGSTNSGAKVVPAPPAQPAPKTPPGPANAARPPRPAPPPPEPLKLLPGFKDLKEQMSYSVGMSIAETVKNGMVDLDTDVLNAAIRDYMTGGTTRLTEEQMAQGIRGWRTASTAKREEDRVRKAEKNHKAGEAFMAENKKKEGVKTHTVTLPGGKTVEMEYKIITEGAGASPKTNDLVTVKYVGRTLDGKEIDNSSKRGPNPVKMMVSRAPCKGWTEAWPLMKAGSKWELYIPSDLARGDRATPDVEPGSTLIYEMELTGVEPPPPPRGSTPAPLTSDIMKVPSAEEIKKGAQPKIMTPAEVEKEMQKEKEKKQ